jgi:hypothetical protein
MPLDSNSRSILGCCVVAVVLLITWFHGNGRGVDHGLSRCASQPAPADDTRDCATCHHDQASRDAALRVDHAGRAPVRIVTSAPRS